MTTNVNFGSSSLSSSASSTSSISCSSYNQTNEQSARHQIKPNGFKYGQIGHMNLVQKQMELDETQGYRKLEDIINEADKMTLSSTLINDKHEEKKIKSILRKYQPASSGGSSSDSSPTMDRAVEQPAPVQSVLPIHQMPVKPVSIKNSNSFMTRTLDFSNYRTNNSSNSSYSNINVAKSQPTANTTATSVVQSSEVDSANELVDKSSCVLPSKLKSQTSFCVTNTTSNTPASSDTGSSTNIVSNSVTHNYNSNRTSGSYGLQQRSYSTNFYPKNLGVYPSSVGAANKSMNDSTQSVRSWSSNNSANNTPVRSNTFTKNTNSPSANSTSSNGVVVKR